MESQKTNIEILAYPEHNSPVRKLAEIHNFGPAGFIGLSK